MGVPMMGKKEMGGIGPPAVGGVPHSHIFLPSRNFFSEERPLRKLQTYFEIPLLEISGWVRRVLANIDESFFPQVNATVSNV